MAEKKDLELYPWWQRTAASLLENALSHAVHSWIWRSLQASGVLLWHADIDAESVALWRSRGLEIVAWTVNDEADKERMRQLGVSFMSDDARRPGGGDCS